MKHIRTFEVNRTQKYSYYWKTTLKRPDFVVAMKKINNLPQDRIKLWSNLFIDKDVPIYICHSFIVSYDYLRGVDDEYYRWDYSNDIPHSNDSIYIYMGEIKPTEEDFKNYEIETNAEKYNL